MFTEFYELNIYVQCRFHVSLYLVTTGLARPGRKQANVSATMARISFGALPCRAKKKTLDDVVEIARVPDMLPSLFPF